MLFCDFIGEEGGKVCFQMADACETQSPSNFRHWEKFEAGIYLQKAREIITYLSPVGNVALFNFHCNTITAFLESLVYDWNVSLNTWNTNNDSEEEGRR